ncbi:hypothetical protein F8388_004729 [Cannabis sativa]|uniref:CCHC-type domain-containing protein n=1 Tax=Cannabis sativa TaxID=3483 RepID=A0A7J6HPE9_CANSA|nr:hypothetical protein F8388_004729 [Cannabis sativa]
MNRFLIRSILGRVWGLAEVDWGVKIKRVTTEAMFMIFSFKNENDLKRIVKKSPWLLNNGVLILQRLSKIPTKWEDELTRFPLAGRVLNLPTISITRNNMLRLATMAGEVIEVQKEEVTQITLNGFFCSKYGFRLINLFVQGFLFLVLGAGFGCRSGMNDKPMCFSCGQAGHDFSTCANKPEKISGGEGKRSAAYGAWLKVEERPLGNREKKPHEEARGAGMIRSRSLRDEIGSGELRKSIQEPVGDFSILDSVRTIGEEQGIDLVPRIANQNSLRVEVPASNPPLPFDFVNLMDKIDVQRVERDFENEGGSGIKRRADYWDFLNRGNGLEHESGKRVHRKVFGVQASSKSGISNEGGE